jgi:type IV pilus biogenesis protein CpaD/CtpE
MHSVKKTCLIAVLLTLSLPLLAACDVTAPSQVTTGKIRLSTQTKTIVLPAQTVDKEQVETITADYARTGKGKISVLVSYLDGNPVNEIKARQRGNAYKSAFQRRGIPKVEVNTVSVATPTDANQAIISYHALTASAPKNCDRLTGYQGGDTLDNMRTYPIGCETKSILSQMIADPSDLMGKAGTAKDDARRAGAVVEPYKAGTPNQPLKGMQASTIGTN